MKLLVVGDGAMGQAIAALAGQRGDEVVGVLGMQDNPAGSALTRERVALADVVLEFTTPEAAASNLLALARAGAAVVSGTTGWKIGLEEVEDAFRQGGGALLRASNFSLGIQLMRQAVAVVSAGLAGMDDWDRFIHERHHSAKLDSPSGTALTLQADATGADPSHSWPIISIRAGKIPGEHEVVFEGPFESLTLHHQARDRKVFAAGALAAAHWLAGRQGVFSIDALFTPTPRT